MNICTTEINICVHPMLKKNIETVKVYDILVSHLNMIHFYCIITFFLSFCIIIIVFFIYSFVVAFLIIFFFPSFISVLPTVDTRKTNTISPLLTSVHWICVTNTKSTLGFYYFSSKPYTNCHCTAFLTSIASIIPGLLDPKTNFFCPPHGPG